MEGYRKFCFTVLCCTAFSGVTSTIKESFNIPEKIIGGVIDIVQSHKNKPSQGHQPSYPPNYQYPQYHQWNGQSNQGQGFQTQPQFQGQQFQNQGQYTNFPQGGNNNFPQSSNNNYPQTGNNNFSQGGNNNYPQSGNNNFPQSGNNNFPQNGNNFPQNGNNFDSSSNFASNQGYPAGPGQSFNQGQTQGQYQGVYQPAHPVGQSNNQHQNTQSGYYTQTQSNNQYQGANTGTGQYTGQPFVSQGQTNQGFQTIGGQGTPGPTCVCQAWTKPPQEIYADSPVTEKNDKKEEPLKERMI